MPDTVLGTGSLTVVKSNKVSVSMVIFWVPNYNKPGIWNIENVHLTLADELNRN